MYMKSKIPRISDAKIKEGVAVGPQIGELKQDAKFKHQLTEVYKSSLEIIHTSHEHFWEGNHKAENYRGEVADLVHSKATGCNMFKRAFIRLALETSAKKISGH